MPRKGIFKRKTLLRNLEAVIERIPQLDLPANTIAVYAFGGILRDKDRLHDFDLVFLYSTSPEQKLRWNRFYKNFATYDTDSGRRPISELMKILEPYRMRGTPLRKVVEDEVVAKFLSKRGIPPQWAGCFSWTEIIRGRHGDGIFFPDISTVIRKMLIGRRFRGLQVFIRRYKDFKEGRTILAPRNYVLAWNVKKTDIRANIEGRSPEEKTDYLIKELDFFVNERIPELRNGSHLGGGFLAACEAVLKRSIEAHVKIDVNALDRQHVNVRRIGDENPAELLEKCELARDEMRKYNTETIVLTKIADVLQHWIEAKDDSYFKTNPPEDYICLWVLQGVSRSDVKEREVRRILQILKLPEDHVVTIKGYGFTHYRLSKDREDRKRLLREAELEKQRRKYLLNIVKAIRPFEKEAHAYLDLDDQGEPKRLLITVWRHVRSDDEAKRKEVIEELRAKGFKAKDRTHYVRGTKQVDLKGNEDSEQLQEIARRMILAS